MTTTKLTSFLLETANLAISRAVDANVKPRITNNRQDFKDLLDRLGGKGMQPLCLIYATTPDLLKTGNPYDVDSIVKVQLTSGQVNRVYEEAVNRNRVKEGKDGDFIAKPAALVPVFTPEGNATPWVRKVKDGELQLRTYNAKASEVAYFHRFSGEQIPTEALQPFFPKKKPSGTQNLENEVRVNNWILDKVLMLRAGGECILSTNLL